MKVKEVERFAYTAWSPATYERTILASVSAEEEGVSLVSSDTRSSPVLELFYLDLKATSLHMNSLLTVPIEFKSTCLCWTSPTSNAQLGLLIVGDATGGLTFYTPRVSFHPDDRTVPSGTDDFIMETHASLRNAHAGVVRGLDCNRFQTNLFASVADEAEILIWDVEKLDQHMSPRNKIQSIEPINTVAWNPRVQHILATASATHCIIRDLRRSDPVAHLTKAMCQFEPRLMAWSPDMATRLCLADPANPTADLQLWDLRYPKHMLALLGRWPPMSGGLLEHVALGNAGTVNSLAWSPTSSHIHSTPSLMLHDSDLIAVSMTASGALPTSQGGCGTGLQPTSADFLVVWSVREALRAVETGSGTTSFTQQPLFVGRLEDSGSDGSPLATSEGLPSNSAVHWLPRHPGLVSVTQPDGWITVINLNAGADIASTSWATKRATQKRRVPSGATKVRRASHKVAEAFGDEVDLSTPSTLPLREMTNGLAQVTFETPQSRISHYHREFQTVGQVLSVSALPQPVPYLRVAPVWMKRPCGTAFGFGGRLVSFACASESRAIPSASTQDVGKSASTNTTHWVSLRWIDTTDARPILGLDGRTSDATLLPTLITWLDEVTSQPVSRLLELCDQWSAICRPRVVTCGSTSINPWAVLRARLQHTDEHLPHILSDLLGYNISVVRTQMAKATSQPIDLPVEPRCLCQSTETCNQANALLKALKMTLVTADLGSSSRLCLHGALSALPCPGLSPLSAVSILLATHTNMNDLYVETQHTLLSTMQRISHKPDEMGTSSDLHAITLLLTAVLQDDWLTLVNRWPLSDWSTCLAALVHHTWSRGAHQFKQLCGALAGRLLDPLVVESSSARSEWCTAAWICAVLTGNLDDLVNALYGMDPALCGEELSGEQLVPTALQVLLVSRYAASTVTTPHPNPAVSHVLSTVALWLGQIGAGRGAQEVTVALRLLHYCLSNHAVHPSGCMTEVMHRLWCNLTDEQRQNAAVIQLRSLIHCPYVDSSGLPTTRWCPCGKSTALASATGTNYSNPIPATAGVAATARSLATSHISLHQQPPMMCGVAQGPALGVTPLLPPMPGALDTYAAASAAAAAPSHMFPPSYTPQSVAMTAPGPSIYSPSGQWSHPPILASSPPPPPRATTGGSAQPPPSASAIPPVPPGITATQIHPGYSTGTSGPEAYALPRPPLPGVQQTQPAFPQSWPLSSHTNMAWNDPPMISKSCEPTPQPAVSVNHFYDPAQYSVQSTGQPPTALHTAPMSHPLQAPPLTQVYPGKPVAFPPVVSTSNVPPPVAQTSYHVSPFAMPSSVGVVSSPPASYQPPPFPSTTEAYTFQHGRFHGDGGEGATATAPAAPFRSMTDHWPAAPPLTVQSSAQPRGPPDHNVAPSNAPSELAGPAVNPECEYIVTTLVGLIQLCRQSGGKPFCMKMNTVEHRLGGLFQLLRSNHLSTSGLSDTMFQHLRACVDAVKRSDFTGALTHANLLIQSSSGFETIHSFGPSLRILMQSARQLFPTSATIPGGTSEATPIFAR